MLKAFENFDLKVRILGMGTFWLEKFEKLNKIQLKIYKINGKFEKIGFLPDEIKIEPFS